MERLHSQKLRDDAHCCVQAAMRSKGMVNMSVVADEIRLGNLKENVALEDIESLVMEIAQLYGAAIEFDDRTLTAIEMPEACGPDNRNDLERALGARTTPDTPVDMLQLDRGE